jgi:putative membrane protein
MMWYWGNGMQWWGWLLMSIGMVAFWSLIIWAIWYLVTTFGRQPTGLPSPDPKRILDERLARGEIDADEYARLRGLLENNSTPSPNGGRAQVGTGGQR